MLPLAVASQVWPSWPLGFNISPCCLYFPPWLPPLALYTVSITTSASAPLWTIFFFSPVIFILLCGALFGGSVCLGSGRLQSPFLSKPLCESEQASSSWRQDSPVPAGSASPVPAAGVCLHTHIRMKIVDYLWGDGVRFKPGLHAFPPMLLLFLLS